METYQSDINLNTGLIKFIEAVNTGFNIRKSPKNHQSRTFPINDSLRQLLESIKPKKFNPEDSVFKSKEGQQLNHSNFLRRAWKGYTNRHKTLVPGIVTKLVDEGKVSHYREPYAMRDTFISHCIERKDATYRQVSEWVGNKPEVIHRHYAGKVETVSVPDLGF